MNNLNSTELAQYQESVKLINNALNKSCKAGTFTLDESYVVKIALSNLEKVVSVLEEVYKNQEQQRVNQEQQALQPESPQPQSTGKTLKSTLSK